MEHIVADGDQKTKEVARPIGGQNRSQRKMGLTERDRQIVRWVHAAGVTTREQVQKLLFGPGGKSRCQERLTLLVRNRFLDVLPNRNVNQPAIYCLSRRSFHGARLLRAEGRLEAVKSQRIAPVRLAHTLEIVSCRVQLVRACGETGIGLIRWADEDEVRQSTAKEGVFPDVFFQLARSVAEGEPKKAGFFLEVERSGKPDRIWREKLRRYGDFYYGGRFEQAFGLRALRILILIGSEYGIRPEQQIERLTELSAQLDVTLVRLASLEAFLNAPPVEFLRAPMWRRPGLSEPCALFESTA